MLAVFDLDGTLIDNELAVRNAYKMAGVTMPDDAWGNPIGDWCTPEQYKVKQEVYRSCLKLYAKDGLGLFYWTTSFAYKTILTGASRRSAFDALYFLGIPGGNLSLVSATLEDKIGWIKKAMLDNPVTYVDCDRRIAEKIKKETKCHILVPV
jgi:hypothetical protein